MLMTPLQLARCGNVSLFRVFFFARALNDGRVVGGRAAAVASGSRPSNLAGRCNDLESAYKQFAISDADTAFPGPWSRAIVTC